MIMKSTLTSTAAGGALVAGHGDDVTITSVVVSPDNQLLASRGTDGKVIVWSLKASSSNQAVPLHVYPDLVNIYPQANVEFSPDSQMLCCGTSVSADVWRQYRAEHGSSSSANLHKVTTLTTTDSSTAAMAGTVTAKPEEKCFLLFFDLTAAGTSAPLLRIAVPGVGSLIYIKWQWNTNQIFCSTTNGFTRVFYDPRLSRKGILLAATKAPKREKDPSDYAIVGEILNPHALPMYRSENSVKKRTMDRRAEAKALVPEKAVVTGPVTSVNNSFFFTHYVMQSKVKDLRRSEDPREALLKYNDLTSKDPMFLGPAYAKTQPTTILYEETLEQEAETFKKKQKQVL